MHKAPHTTPHGPLDLREWRKLLRTAPRTKGERPLIQVCTGSDGRPIHATVAYAEHRARKD
jgi:hypothetical protein